MSFTGLRLFCFSLFFLLAIPMPPLWAADCMAPEICHRLKRRFDASSTHPESRAAFLALLETARVSLYRDCNVQGIDEKKIPNFKACYFQGFIEKKGKFQKPADALYAEEEVQRWFRYIQSSEFPEGRQFTSSNEFAAALDPSWRLELLPEGSWSITD